MTIDDIIELVRGFDGVLVLQPGPGDGSPEIAWGDTFFYYSPDGIVPERTQPFATIVTKDYPGDEASRLTQPGRFRLNLAAGKQPADDPDPSATDTVFRHPVYGSAGWLAVVNPGPRTDAAVRELLDTAYHRARRQYERRAARPQS